MATMHTGVVYKVKFIKHLEDNLDLCELEIDFDRVMIFYNANELSQFIDKDVTYSTRRDVIDGQPVTVVCELALVRNIQTVESTKNIKLIPEGTSRTICNADSKTFRMGEFYGGIKCILSKITPGCSSKASWFDLTLLDKNSREFSVKMFTNAMDKRNSEEALSTMVGKYVQMDLEYTRYGLSTSEIDLIPVELEESPEVIVAKEIIMEVIASDSALAEFNQRYDFINHIAAVIDGEPGYALVRMASEIYMINAVDNISTELNIVSMKRAVICSRSYLLPHDVEWSRPMLNVTRTRNIQALKSDIELMMILDVLATSEQSSTKKTYIKLKGLVNDIIDIRRGVINEESSNGYNAIVNSFSGLL